VTEGQQVKSVIEEEEQILKFVPMEGKPPIGLPTQWELDLKEMEDWLHSSEPEGVLHKIVMLEKIHHHELQLEEVRMELAEELSVVNMLEVIAKKNPSDEKSAGVKDTTVWKTKAIRDEEYNLGDQCDLPIDQEEV
jgi:hypothetical protein